jgi:NADH dehydrogenase
VLLTGASGFVGREVLRRLLGAGNEVVAVSQHPPAGAVPARVIQVAADVTGSGWQRWCEGCSAAINLVGVIRESPRHGVTFDGAHRACAEQVVAACRDHDIRRLVHVSALGARRDAATPFQRSKWQGEEIVRGSGLTWTIVRPALIFGPDGGFFTSLATAVKRLPVFPIFGDGAYLLQPLAVGELAAALVAALETGASEGEVVELGGPETLAYDEVVRRTAAALGLRRTLVHLPLGLVRFLVRVMQWLPGAPITPDQLTMLLAGSHCETAAASLLFDPPRQQYQGPVWMVKQ